MISKDRRLTKAEIVELKKNSQKFVSPNFLILFKKNQLNKNKIAVVISKRIEKLAVNRNKIKREIINSISDTTKKFAKSSLSLVIYPTKQFISLALEKKKQSLTEDIKKICQKNYPRN